MSVKVLLDDVIHLSYATIQVGADDDPGDPEAPWRGQVNGLCGAGAGGWLELTTGLHTGQVRFTVELHTTEPPLGDDWEEAVEVPFRNQVEDMWLGGLMSDGYPITLPPGEYRVRYCARGMEEGRQQDTTTGDSVVDAEAYCLQFWQAPAEPDRIVRQTTGIAAYWHENHPKPPLSAADHAERRRRETEARVREEDEFRELLDGERWGDRRPTERLREAAEQANPVDRLDPDAVFALAETDDDTCAAVALWAAERAVAVAGLEQVPWVAEALAARRNGDPLPPPFPARSGTDDDYPAEVWDLLDDADLPLTTVTLPEVVSDGEAMQISRPHVALPAVFATADRPPLTAAMNALWAAAAAHGEEGYRQFFAELRVVFPQLGR